MADLFAVSPEEALLGAVLCGYRRIDALTEIVQGEDFESPLHERIWAEILDARGTVARIDPLIIADRWSARYGYGKAPVAWPGPTYLTDLMGKVPSAVNAPYYAWMVAEGSARRGLQSAAQRIAGFAESGLAPVDIADRAKRALENAAVKARPPQVTTIGAAFERFMDALDHPDESTRADWPWPDLNRYVPRLRPGMVVVVGATPSVGKSLIATNLAAHLAGHGIRTLLSSLEMSEYEIVARLVAACARVDLGKLIHGQLDGDAMQRVAARHQELTSGPLTIEQAASQTVANIGGRAAATEAQVTIVDYLQLVRPIDPSLPRHEQVAQISRDLKLMAKERRTCVVAPAQLNREATRRGAPNMSDLRESGAIEANSDVVLLLHREDPDVPELRVIVEKNRNGPKGMATLHVQGHYARIVPATTV